MVNPQPHPSTGPDSGRGSRWGRPWWWYAIGVLLLVVLLVSVMRAFGSGRNGGIIGHRPPAGAHGGGTSPGTSSPTAPGEGTRQFVKEASGVLETIDAVHPEDKTQSDPNRR